MSGPSTTARTNVVASAFDAISASVIAQQGFASYPFARSVSGTTQAKESVYMNVLNDVTGSVRIVQLTDHQICLDIDVEFTSQDKLIYAAKGVVASEVVRSADSSFFS